MIKGELTNKIDPTDINKYEPFIQYIKQKEQQEKTETNNKIDVEFEEETYISTTEERFLKNYETSDEE